MWKTTCLIKLIWICKWANSYKSDVQLRRKGRKRGATSAQKSNNHSSEILYSGFDLSFQKWSARGYGGRAMWVAGPPPPPLYPQLGFWVQNAIQIKFWFANVTKNYLKWSAKKKDRSTNPDSQIANSNPDICILFIYSFLQTQTHIIFYIMRSSSQRNQPLEVLKLLLLPPILIGSCLKFTVQHDGCIYSKNLRFDL